MRMKKEKLKRLKEIENYCLKEAIDNALNADGVISDVVEASSYEVKRFKNDDTPIYGEKENKPLVNILMRMERSEKSKLRKLVERMRNYCVGLEDAEQLEQLGSSAQKLAEYTAEKGYQAISRDFLELYSRYSPAPIEQKTKFIEGIAKEVVSGYAYRNLYTGMNYKNRAIDTIEEVMNGRYGDIIIDIDKLISAYNSKKITVNIDRNYHDISITDQIVPIELSKKEAKVAKN